MMEVLYENYFAILVGRNIVAILSTSFLLFYKRNGIIIPPIDERLEIKLLINIKIYGNRKIVKKITHLINKYLIIWESSRFMQVPAKYWIKVHLKPK